MADTELYRWKVIKSTVNQPDRMKFFYSDEDLMDYLEKVLESYEDEGYCDFNGGDIETITKQVIKIGNKVITQTGTGIRGIVKLK